MGISSNIDASIRARHYRTEEIDDRQNIVYQIDLDEELQPTEKRVCIYEKEVPVEDWGLEWEEWTRST